jgi:hypothetical protein
VTEPDFGRPRHGRARRTVRHRDRRDWHPRAEGHAPEKSLDAIDAEAMARTFAVNAIGPALILAMSQTFCRARGGRSWAC